MRRFLADCKLSQYAEDFESAGFDDLPFLRLLLARGELHAVLTGELLGMKQGHALKLGDYLGGGV